MRKKIKNETLQENEMNYISYFDDISDTSDMISNSIKEKDFKIKLNSVFDTLNENEIANNEISYVKVQSIEEINSYLKAKKQVADAFLSNAKTDKNLKIIYGILLLILLTAQLVLVNVIFVLGGLGILKYADTTFDIFITGSLIEVVVIVRIVVKYLFTDNISKTFNNVMEQQSNHKNNKT